MHPAVFECLRQPNWAALQNIGYWSKARELTWQNGCLCVCVGVCSCKWICWMNCVTQWHSRGAKGEQECSWDHYMTWMCTAHWHPWFPHFSFFSSYFLFLLDFLPSLLPYIHRYFPLSFSALHILLYYLPCFVMLFLTSVLLAYSFRLPSFPATIYFSLLTSLLPYILSLLPFFLPFFPSIISQFPPSLLPHIFLLSFLSWFCIFILTSLFPSQSLYIVPSLHLSFLASIHFSLLTSFLPYSLPCFLFFLPCFHVFCLSSLLPSLLPYILPSFRPSLLPFILPSFCPSLVLYILPHSAFFCLFYLFSCVSFLLLSIFPYFPLISTAPVYSCLLPSSHPCLICLTWSPISVYPSIQSFFLLYPPPFPSLIYLWLPHTLILLFMRQ